MDYFKDASDYVISLKLQNSVNVSTALDKKLLSEKSNQAPKRVRAFTFFKALIIF